jgi:hypothetical protein
MMKLFTVRMTAALFHKHENTVYRWLLDDRLFPNAFQINGGWFIPENDVRRLLKDGRLNRAAADPHRTD